jgi:butyryl-CoA dehydrogenase
MLSPQSLSLPSKLVSRRDLDFLLYEWLGVERLTECPRFADHSRATFDAALDLASRLAEEHFAPHNRRSDAEEPRFDGTRVHIVPEVKAALDEFARAGLLAAAHEYEFGGMQLPYVLVQACLAHFYAANVSTSAYAMLTMANANVVKAFGTEEQKRRFLPPLLDGRFFGTMCLSEPQAGSSLADLRTRAEPAPDGTFRLFGNKMWISGGEHDMAQNIVHLVLARLPGAPPGVKGISLFIVPKRLVNGDGSLGAPNDVALAGLNHKMGYRGTVNCVLSFGERDGAIGDLVGEPHHGLAYMFHMMNEARIAVGLGATMLGYTGYLHALDYARSRPQGRPLQDKDPEAPQVPIVEHADVRRMLLAQKSYAEGGLALGLFCALLVDERDQADAKAHRREAALLLDVLTPIAKSWPSQWGPEANSLAIQVHGGYGYTREYGVEQFYRDNRLNPIHEGTHGIQALDLLGRKVVMENGAGLALLARAMRATAETAGAADDVDLVYWGNVLAESVADLEETTGALHAAGDPDRTLANASVYLEMTGHVVVAWLWLEQALVAQQRHAAGESDEAFYRGKLQACRYFFEWELPKTAAQHTLLRQLDTTCLDMRNEWF